MNTKSLFLKLFIRVSLLFFATILVSSFFTDYSLDQHLKKEYRSKGLAVSKSISDSSIGLIANSDANSISTILNDYLEIDGVIFIIMRDKNLKILAHTIVSDYTHLLSDFELKELDNGHLKTDKISHIKLDKYGDILEVVSPIQHGELGYVHIGLSLSPIYTTIKNTIIKNSLLILALFIISIYFLYAFIKKITRPIEQLTSYSNALTQHTFKQPLRLQSKIQALSLSSTDEIGVLSKSFVGLENQLIAYIKNLEETTRAKEKMENELKIAADIQISMLPNRAQLAKDLPLKLQGTLIPATEVGGDFYDYFIKDNTCFFAIGDVSGKGVPAALFMSASLTMIKSTTLHTNTVSEVLTTANNLLTARNEQCLFVSVFFGALDMLSGELSYCNAGHPPPFILNKNGSLQKIPLTNGMALGIEEGFYYEQKTLTLNPDDILILFTDGINEAENTKQELYGDTRLETVFKHIPKNSTCKDINDLIIKDVQNFTLNTPQSDDITLLSLKWQKPNISLKGAIKVHFKNDLQELNKLQQVVELFSEENKLSTKHTMTINLILEELLTNIILYGYKSHKEELIYVLFKLQASHLFIEIEDNGIAFNPINQKEVDTTKSLDDIDVGGLGIHFIKNLTQDIHYTREENKNKLSLKIDIKGDTDENIS